jgi:hypothetical protein
MSTAPEQEALPPFAQTREFWILMVDAVALGIFGAFAGLVFMGVVGVGAAFMTQVGALQTAPILIAVVTAFLVMEAVKYLIVSRKQRAVVAQPH